MSSARSVPSASGVCAFAAHEGLAHRPSPVGCRARSVSCGPTANMSSPHGASPGSGLYSPNETSTSSVRKHHERVGDTVGTCSSGAGRLAPLEQVPTVSPTRSWCFRTLDVDVSFGEYKPEPGEAPWGLDMFAVGPHETERALQPTGDGLWARPSWAANAQTPDALGTD